MVVELEEKNMRNCTSFLTTASANLDSWMLLGSLDSSGFDPFGPHCSRLIHYRNHKVPSRPPLEGGFYYVFNYLCSTRFSFFFFLIVCSQLFVTML